MLEEFSEYAENLRGVCIEPDTSMTKLIRRRGPNEDASAKEKVGNSHAPTLFIGWRAFRRPAHYKPAIRFVKSCAQNQNGS